ncbi:MAG TPA: hypothetical protein VNJ04_13555 [Gemmatimonadaceae bacterium]|nr:hypothetical protein [Gemmatimonadaceae bacterium]
MSNTTVEVCPGPTITVLWARQSSEWSRWGPGTPDEGSRRVKGWFDWMVLGKPRQIHLSACACSLTW